MHAANSTPATCQWRRCLFAALTAAVCALATSACGSSGQTASAPSHPQASLQFSECMRSHGVPNFPDPGGSGGINLDGTGINPFSPSFEGAQAVCRRLLPGGGPGSRHVTEQQKERIVATSECMRSHGVSGFPDPTSKAPTSLQSLGQYSIAEGIGSDLWLLVPNTIDVNSPAFTKAAKACDFR